jgi:hypothetical protein
MPTDDRTVPRFAAEPPQDLPPSGPWAQRLREEFLAACLRLEADQDAGALGEVGEPAWHPDRTWHGRTFVPVTARTATGLETYGFVRYVPAAEGQTPSGFHAHADVTGDVAEENPDWTIDLCDEVVGRWRGEDGAVAAMTLVWGRPLVDGADTAVAELGGIVVDRCALVDGRFTLLAPDGLGGDTLEVVVLDRDGGEVARESLYEEDEEDEDLEEA